MKQFHQLSPPQQERAIAIALERLLTAIAQGLRFNDAANGNALQDRIDRAWEQATREQVPHMWGDFILTTCREDLTRVATMTARDAVYVNNETVISLDDVEEPAHAG
jgi:hypothetical protein